MIRLERRDGRPLLIGHRGAAAVAPENTIASFRAAVDAGVDLVELDVFALRSGELVVAHSNDLYEVSHGTLRGTVAAFSLAELRKAVPDLPTFEDALEFFAAEARTVGIHVDVKARGYERDVVDALTRHGLRERSLLSTFHVRSARAFAELAPEIPLAISLPRSIAGITEGGRGARVARVGLTLLRWSMPLLVRPVLAASKATALALHHRVITGLAVRRAHARSATVVAWTVDMPTDVLRVEAAGVDAVVTNDPAMFASTLES